MELIGKNIGRYRVETKIGSGAMADVYEAFDSEINRPVAIKALKRDVWLTEKFTSRFLSEAKASGILSQSNIVTIYDVGRYENVPYIVMELVDGETLGDKLERHERFSIKQTVRLMLQLANALDYAHRKGIVHRDVKPDNILFMPDNETAKLADFGIAHREDSSETQVGTILGTPRYMSPEQARGEPIDGRSDLFSLGVILYELLTGEKAFTATSISNLAVEINNKQPELLGRLPKTVPWGLQHILRRLLEKKVSKRPSSGREVVEALQWELDAIIDEEEKQKHKYVPLHVKWSAMMGAVVAIILTVSMAVVLNIQSQVLTDQAVGSGVSLTKFIASESAIPVLQADWITIESLVKDAGERNTFKYLTILDHDRIVRGATDLSLVGKTLSRPEIENVIFKQEGARVSSTVNEDGGKVFNFETPIFFGETEVGQVQLGLPQDRLERIKGLTTWLMALLGVVALISVVVVLFIFGRMISLRLRVLRSAFVEFNRGSLDRRIYHERSDEIGDLYRLFNEMAKKVQNLSPGDEAGIASFPGDDSEFMQEDREETADDEAFTRKTLVDENGTDQSGDDSFVEESSADVEEAADVENNSADIEDDSTEDDHEESRRDDNRQDENHPVSESNESETPEESGSQDDKSISSQVK